MKAYAYDAAGRLISESRPGYSAGYAYDGNGNRTSRVLGGATRTYLYDDGDKLLSASEGGTIVRSYSYDAAGRTTSANGASIFWDARGYASSVSGTAMTTNGLGARTVEGAQSLLRDGAGVLAPVLADGAATYTPGLAERRSGTLTAYHGDLKSSAMQTAGGAVSAGRSYDAFGNVLASNGTWKGSSGYGGSFGYRETSGGLKLLGHRLYDSETGRFLSRDPARDGRNWYQYCGGDPVNGAVRAGGRGTLASCHSGRTPRPHRGRSGRWSRRARHPDGTVRGRAHSEPHPDL